MRGRVKGSCNANANMSPGNVAFRKKYAEVIAQGGSVVEAKRAGARAQYAIDRNVILARNTLYRKSSKGQATVRRGSRKKYGIRDLAAAEKMSREATCCEICGRTGVTFYIDHVHSTGELRKALCNQCNTGLGLFQDSPAQLMNAVEYLHTHGFDGQPWCPPS